MILFFNLPHLTVKDHSEIPCHGVEVGKEQCHTVYCNVLSFMLPSLILTLLNSSGTIKK